MLFTTRINDLVAACPRLSRVWIKTGNPKLPLRAVWLDESKVQELGGADGNAALQDEVSEQAEEHLCLAA